ncbi:hypothetical protein [Umezawaea sp. Da 62-37]|uniref:hypothetical protein n=1 Tax=Umezawaea sp. Da 62-37 TaxID=3075927 RepID=UPI0028F73B53|nr:hypothetical protein [Umezawaea sp. Da 62-37]WNV84240.1 hypothetical protein RM788_39700 [Umezawaea sp. Da 62-37]
MTASPNSAAPGDGFTATWSDFTYVCAKGDGVTILWDNQQAIGSGTTGRSRGGSAGVAVPAGAPAGFHTVVAQGACNTARTTFTVVVPTPPTTTTTPPAVTTTTTPPPVVTNPAPTTTTATLPPGVTTTTTTTTDPSSSSSSAPSSSGSGSSSTLPLIGDGALTLDKDNIQPGEPLNATGTGCSPGSDVQLSSLDEEVGKAKADGSGKFSAPVEFSTIEPGRHVIRAQCDILLVGSVDVSLTSATSGTSSTLVVLVFFVLIGATMLRRQFSALRLPAKN